MGEKEITQIRVGKHTVSITGLKEAIAAISATISKVAETGSELNDRDIGTDMLSALGKHNYIPSSAEEQYREAFVREFRKALCLPWTEPAPDGLEIKVLGGGCNQCSDLNQLVMEVLTELNSPANLEHVKDMKEIARYGVLGVPALVVNGRVVCVGSIPPKDRIKSWILESSSTVRQKG